MKKVKFFIATMMFTALAFSFNACSNTDQPLPTIVSFTSAESVTVGLGANLNFDVTVNVVNGSGTTSFEFTGLPSWVTKTENGNKVTLTGTAPATEGSFSVTIKATNNKVTATQNFKINVGSAAEGDGTKNNPYNVGQVLGFYAGSASLPTGVWVKGFIVGGVKTTLTGGGTTIQSADDIVFGTTDIRNTAVLIATSASETDYTKCVVVELGVTTGFPADLRSKVNLVSNPGNLGKELSILGNLARYFAFPGVRSITDFVFDGGTVNPTETDPEAVPALAEDFEGFKEGTGLAYFNTQTDNKGWFGFAIQGTLQPDIRLYNNNRYVQFSAHRNTGVNAGDIQEMWLVSPRLNVTAATSKILSFQIAAGYYNANSQFKVYVFSGDEKNPSVVTNKTELTGFTMPTNIPATSYSEFVPSGNIDLSAYSGTIRIGFYYKGTSGSGNSTTYQLDNFAFGTSMTTLSVSPESLSFAKEGGAKTFTVTSNTTWTAVSSDNANFPVSISGNTVTVTATANTAETARTATVTVSTDNGLVTKTVNLTQAGNTVVTGNVVFLETFTNVSGTPWTAGTTALTDYSSFDKPGWTGDKVYPAGGVIKLGTSTALGYVTTPSIDLSANGGNFTLVFKSLVWYNNTQKIKVYVNSTMYETETIGQYDTNNPTPPQEVVMTLSGGTANTKIKFEGYQAANGRFYLDEVKILQ